MNQQIQQNMTPGPMKTFQQNQPVINPADGKSYNVQQQTPGKGITLIDPTTNQTVMVSEQDSQNLQPAIKTTADENLSKKATLFRFHRSTLKESLDTVIEVFSLEELEEILKNKGYRFNNVEINPYMRDDRIWWDTYSVSIDGQIVGFADGPLNMKTTADQMIDEVLGVKKESWQQPSLPFSLDRKAYNKGYENIGEDENNPLNNLAEKFAEYPLNKEYQVKFYDFIADKKLNQSQASYIAGYLSDHYNLHNLIDIFQGRTSSDFSIEAIASSIVEELTGERLPEVKITAKKVFTNPKAHDMRRNWNIIRKEIKTQSQMNPQEIQAQPTYNEPRQSRAIRELSATGYLNKEAKYNPYKGDLIKEVGRDKKTGLPMRGGDDIEVGLTEFPYGVNKEKNPEGYSAMTMEEMDNKYEQDHDHFKNEQLLPDYTKKREESDTYLNRTEREKNKDDLRKDFNVPRYSTSEENNTKEASIDQALDEVLGVKKKVAEITPIPPEKKPVEYKETKTAPKIEEYVEPEVLEQASPDVKAAIEMFKDTQNKIASIKSQIDEKTKPLQQAILDATKELNLDLAKNAALLKTSLDMLYTELEKTSDKVAVINDEIYAAIGREKPVAPPASLPQILKKAETVNPQLVTEIGKIKALVESDNTKMVIEQFLYKYPVSEPQKKKIKAALEEGNLEQFLTEINNIVESLQLLNESI